MSTYWGNHWTEVRRKRENERKINSLISISLSSNKLFIVRACPAPPYSSWREGSKCSNSTDLVQWYPASLINDDWPRRFWLSLALRPHAVSNVASLKIDTLTGSLDFISSFSRVITSLPAAMAAHVYIVFHQLSSPYWTSRRVSAWATGRERARVSYC